MTGTLPSRLAVLTVFLATLVDVAAARATTVLLIQPDLPTRTTAEAMVRMHGELVSAGFDVQVVTRPPATDARASLEAAAADFHADAVVGILGSSTENGVEVWVIDKVTGKILVRRVPIDAPPDRASEVLAIRSLELLRASFLEVEMTPSPAAAKPNPPKVVKRYVSQNMEARKVFLHSIELGGEVEGGFGGLGVAVTPHARIGRVLFQNGWVRLLLSGLGTRARVRNGGTQAKVWQEVALLDLGYRWRAGKRVRPMVSLGGGVAKTNGEGEAPWPYAGTTAHRWSGVVDGGLGVDIHLRGRFDLSVEVHARFLQPYPAIRFLETTQATLGRPGIVVQVGLLSWI